MIGAAKVTASDAPIDEFCARNMPLVTTFARNRAPFTSMHSHAAAPELSGSLFRVYDGVKVPLSARSPQKRAEGLCGGAAKHCYVKSVMPARYGKNNAGGAYVRAGHADNQSAPHRRPMNIITLRYRASAPPPRAEPFFCCPGHFRLAETDSFFHHTASARLPSRSWRVFRKL